jgi:hypothetical protein
LTGHGGEPCRLHDVRHSYAPAALAAGIPAKVVSERLGHASIAITMDTYSHVLPGLDGEAAGTVARLILGDAEQEPARPVDKALTTDHPTPSSREEVKREAPGQGDVRAGGFEPPRVPHRDLNCPRGVLASALLASTMPSSWTDAEGSSRPVPAHPGVSRHVL